MNYKSEWKRGYEEAKSEMSGGIISPEDLLEHANRAFDNDFYRGWTTACKEALESPAPKKPTNPVLKMGFKGSDNYTLRDKIAIAAMQGELAAQTEETIWFREYLLADRAYKIADEMLKAREL